MKNLIIMCVLFAISCAAIACDYEYTDTNGSNICATEGEQEVTITVDNGDEHQGEWVGNGEVQDNETGEVTEVSQ
ncbi:hypothetical protein [Enterobacter asburiae]|jgi:hypothetical protein|uniref:hypothetical protein n=1 Tax=Enterobacter asburiae TaxID=61645 RepID=UPI002B83CAB7|nr:hypothetical protein [Enterobacter asburiae]